MDYKQIIKDIQAKNLKPIYLLHGEEAYFIDRIIDALENVLTEDEKAFNQTVIYGKETDITDLINMCKRFPMMAPYQVIIVKEAQYLRKIEELKHYAKNPVNSTILVVSHKEKSVDKRKSFVKELAKTGLVFESKPLYENQIPSLITKLVEEKGKRIDVKSSHLLVEFLGNDLSKLFNEIDKLLITLPNTQETITPEHIEKNIGYSKDFNVFELQNAIGKKDVLKANRIVNYFESNPKHSINEVIPILFRYFQNIFKLHYLKDKSKQSIASTLGVNPFFSSEYLNVSRNYDIRKTVQVIEILRDYDLKSKGIGFAGGSADQLLKEMLFKILH
jgi:DNA polymerase-3 subunit delta